MKTCVLLSHMPNPRFMKRIKVIQTVSDVYLICVKREGINLWETQKDLFVRSNVIEMKMPTARHFISRILALRKFMQKAHQALQEYKPDVIYMEGLDCLLIANNYQALKKNVKLYYEIGDLRAGIKEKNSSIISQLVGRVSTVTEKRMLKNIYKIVVTSELFYTRYYSSFFSKEKCLFLPNLPDLSVFKNFIRKRGGKFTVGFIGAIRYISQMKLLIDATEGLGVNVFFAGGCHEPDVQESLKEYAKNRVDVEFLGSYEYESEVAKLYGKADCIYSVYDTKNQNARMALPNKLYESIICGLPIIVAKDTYLGELVREWRCGVTVSDNNAKELREAINSLKSDKDFYAKLVENCNNKAQDFSSVDTGQLLSDELRKLIGRFE